MLRILLSLLFLTPLSPAFAQSPLDAAGFDALTKGKTFYYSSDGQPYGGEEYLDNHRVRWSFLDGHCQNGKWWQQGENICFAYDESPDVHCWTFEQGTSGLIAHLAGDPPGRALYEMQQNNEPLYCLGPDVGT
ncbi:hypothetical protein U5922_012025 [Aquicoccus sp. G2-2]|uniref:hypothetical protein n=1 Tax=Aquicoccus sp. G2-2 TaxID=3092120 RepID=UPI002ADFF9A1|nr:hypothetical protein [Aquicoccus sp. G2-2]MEA1114147.1 hypothetical protein [Aquicoccus sp. G2-2]